MNKARAQGLEGILRLHPTSAWTLELAQSYTQAWDEKTGIGLIGNPRNKTTFSVIGQVTPEWQLSGNVLYISPRDTFDAVSYKRVNTPSYTIIGAETSYQLNDQWQVYGRGENLLNRQYENPQSLQQPGLGIYIGLRARC
jgi:vitamin B12 transporter